MQQPKRVNTMHHIVASSCNDVPVDIFPHLGPVEAFFSLVECSCGTKMAGTWVIVHGAEDLSANMLGNDQGVACTSGQVALFIQNAVA